MDDPSRVLAEARQHLKAMRQVGLDRNELANVMGGEPQQHEHSTSMTHEGTSFLIADDDDSTGIDGAKQTFYSQELSYRSTSYRPPSEYRSSISTISSTSSRDSWLSGLSATSVHSSPFSTKDTPSKPKFLCTSCNNTFKRKFDWKRHEDEFHDRSRYYPCDKCNQGFWGPNTFNQHHKSSHGCQTCPHAKKVMKQMRRRSAYGCGFCAALHSQFGPHLDHVAAHYENGMAKSDWSHSNVIYGLLRQNVVHAAWMELIAKKYNEYNEYKPMFRWSQDATGRAQGFVESDRPGQLQDLLEFFDNSQESAQKIVQLAEKHVLVVLQPKMPSPSSAGVEDITPLPPAPLQHVIGLPRHENEHNFREPPPPRPPRPPPLPPGPPEYFMELPQHNHGHAFRGPPPPRPPRPPPLPPVAVLENDFKQGGWKEDPLRPATRGRPHRHSVLLIQAPTTSNTGRTQAIRHSIESPTRAPLVESQITEPRAIIAPSVEPLSAPSIKPSGKPFAEQSMKTLTEQLTDDESSYFYTPPSSPPFTAIHSGKVPDKKNDNDAIAEMSAIEAAIDEKSGAQGVAKHHIQPSRLLTMNNESFDKKNDAEFIESSLGQLIEQSTRLSTKVSIEQSEEPMEERSRNHFGDPLRKPPRESSSMKKTLWNSTNLSEYISWLIRVTRPKLKVGHRRIEWKCDCGKDLYADFSSNDGEQLDDLAFSLQNPGEINPNQASNFPLGNQNTDTSNFSEDAPKSIAKGIKNSLGHLVKRYPTTTASSSVSSQVGVKRPRFLALCVNKGGIYKTLTEIDTSAMTSDAVAFSIMRNEYYKTRGLRSRFKFLIKATTIEFVQFTLWNRRGAYVSICSRPDSIPPEDFDDYEYYPKPLKPLLPMPAEIFIHYLEHGEGDLNPVRNDWLPRLPKRLDKRVIDCNEACLGWGMHIIEGPNREVIFWIAMVTILASVLTSVLWSTLRGDVQGGTGLGALIVALPPAILAAFLFRLEGI
ncbi:hypothetical protein F5Y16DRAFT_383060 [Xylariaceae sp. FL0255]|nr:hypothetical protein F5Y16DRAFT_383060 [Xylariaceae sp. FL0255]